MKNCRSVLSVVLCLLLLLLMTGCGMNERPDAAQPQTATEAAELAAGDLSMLSSIQFSTSTWSSPNGATVHLRVVPAVHADSDLASFVVRLEGESMAMVPCEWDGTGYSASADLNAEDGYCYFLVVTDAAGKQTEYPVNTPTQVVDLSVINLAASLDFFCSLSVTSSGLEDGILTVSGQATVQAPTILNDGQSITCSDAVLILSLGDQEVGRQELNLAPGNSGAYSQEITDLSFQTPTMQEADQLALRMVATLSNGQVAEAPCGTWFYSENALQSAVG